MLQKTRGIVLNYIKFKESSIIVKIYTEDFGLQSYIVNGIRSKGSKKSLALFQPLTLLELVVYSKKNENKQDGIKRLSEYKTSIAFQSIPFDIKKTSIAIFITELISKSLKGIHLDENRVFDFLYNGIIYFDKAIKGFENFHVQLLIQLSSYIGFEITGKDELKYLKSNFLNLGAFHSMTALIIILKDNTFDSNIKVTNEQRKMILDLMLTYYATHIDDFGTMRSKAILSQVYSL